MFPKRKKKSKYQTQTIKDDFDQGLNFIDMEQELKFKFLCQLSMIRKYIYKKEYNSIIK